MNVGDEVNYLPHECHALDKDTVNNERAWVLGRKYNRQVKEHGKPPSHVPDVEELEDRAAEQYIEFINRSPNPMAERANLVFIRPKRPWKGVIKAVHVDGTVNIAVQSCVGGVTLHYDNVPVSSAHTPHTCHLTKAPEEEPTRE